MSPARRAIFGVGLAAAIIGAAWCGCSSSAPAAPDGAPADAGGDAPDAIARADAGPADAGPNDSGQPPLPDGAVPCKWPGWYEAPQLTKNCHALCIPDDPVARLPAFIWDNRDDLCAGCRVLETPWAPDAGLPKRALLGGLSGTGSGPSYVGVGLNRSKEQFTTVVLDQLNRPQAAWREDVNNGPDMCGALMGGNSYVDPVVGLHIANGFNTHYTFVLPIDDISKAMRATTPSITWTKSFLAGKYPNWVSVSASTVALDLGGPSAIGRVQSGSTVLVPPVDAGLTGQWGNPVVGLNGDVFISRSTSSTSGDEWVYDSQDQLRPFLGTSDTCVVELVTDGKLIIWKLASQQSYDAAHDIYVYGRYDIYVSPYTNDASKLQPKLLWPNSPKAFGALVFTNGYLAGVAEEASPHRNVAYVVRVADGEVRRAVPPNGWNWGLGVFPSGTELWGTVTSDFILNYGDTALRMPYTAMEIVVPGGGG